MNFLCLRFNNYFNRKIKYISEASGKATLDKYIKSADVYYNGSEDVVCRHFINNINFNPSDGITTTQVLNWNQLWMPDYLVCYSGEYNEAYIESRWFITKMVRTRKSQYTCYLKRDTVSDNYSSFRNATAFIDKGYVDISNDLFLNQEPITANQIKIKESLITDIVDTGNSSKVNSTIPWIVGYVANKWDTNQGNEAEIEVKVPGSTFDWNGWNNFPLKNFISKEGTVNLVYLNDITAKLRLGTGFLGGDGWEGYYKDIEYNVFGKYIESGQTDPQYHKNASADDMGNVYSTYSYFDYSFLFFGSYKADASYLPVLDVSKLNKTQVSSAIMTSGFTGVDGLSSVKPVSGIVKDGGNYYQVTVTEVTSPKTSPMSETVINLFKDACTVKDGKEVFSKTTSKAVYEVASYYQVKVTKITDDIIANHTFTCNMSTAFPLNDAPYKMFCFPLLAKPNQTVMTKGYVDGQLTQGIKLNRDAILQIIGGLITGLGTNLYDIQILPYCPIRGGDLVQNPAMGGNNLTITGSDNVHTSVIKNGEQTVGHLFWSAKSTFSFVNTYYYNPIDYSNPIKTKRLATTQFARLVSPNQANTFEFGVVQNNGIVKLEIDCQYKPFSPHIHVKPVFSRLYGKNWTNDGTTVDSVDTRGLLCSGDFSFPQTTNQWVQYELDNKNYQIQFNREIDTLELNQKWAERGAVINGITGAVGSTAKGAIAGGMAGGGVAGLAVGAAAGAATGVIDTVYNYEEVKALGRDAIDLKEDLYNYNLQNIQARPNNLTNIGALSPDFKYFPYIEIYDCTDAEAMAIENKLKYEGFTLGVVGTIDNYIGTSQTTNFIRGALTRIDNVVSPTEAQDIANELARGLYIED